MKKLLQLAVIATFLTSFQASAHHAAEAIVDEDTYDMIDENIEDADSPHLDMTADDLLGAASQ